MDRPGPVALEEVRVLWFVLVNDELLTLAGREEVSTAAIGRYAVASVRGVYEYTGLTGEPEDQLVAVDLLVIRDDHASVTVRTVPRVDHLDARSPVPQSV